MTERPGDEWIFDPLGASTEAKRPSIKSCGPRSERANGLVIMLLTGMYGSSVKQATGVALDVPGILVDRITAQLVNDRL